LSASVLFAACSNNNSSPSGNGSSGTKVQTITVATSAASVPYQYTKDGKFTGFETEILEKADADLPQYSFKFMQVDDSSILLQLDSQKAQIAANNFGKTKARESKYLFSCPLTEGINAIFSNSKSPITTIAGLAGKKTEIPTGTNYGDILTTWNQDNPSKKVDITYSQRTLTDRLTAVGTGGIDFLFASKSAAENLVKSHGITGVTDSIPTDLNKYPEFKTYEYFVLADDQQALQTALNKEIKKFAEDGTLKALSEKYFGDDQVPGMDQYK